MTYPPTQAPPPRNQPLNHQDLSAVAAADAARFLCVPLSKIEFQIIFTALWASGAPLPLPLPLPDPLPLPPQLPAPPTHFSAG